MKFIRLCICLVLVTLSCSLASPDWSRQGDCEKVPPLVVYGIPLRTFTGFPYRVDDVIRTHSYSVNIRDPRRGDVSELIDLLGEIKKGEASQRSPGVNLRFICVLNKGGISSTLGCGESTKLVYIDGVVYDRSEETERLFDILEKYIPPFHGGWMMYSEKGK